MNDCDKVTALKSKNWSGLISDNDWVTGADYENLNDNYSEEDQEDKDYIDS